MDKKISALIGENAVLKNEVVVELKKSLQFHTDQWEESFKTLDSLKNELLQKKNPVIPDLIRNQRQAERFRKP